MVAIGIGGDRRDRAIGDLHHRPAGRQAVEQAFQQRHAHRHREVQERNAGDDAIEGLVAEGAKRRLKIEGVAVDEVHAGIGSQQMLVEIRRIFDGDQIVRLHAAAEDRFGDGARARPEFEHRQPRMHIDDAGHALGGDRGGRHDRAHRLRPLHHATEEADFLIESLPEMFLHLDP
ncbi:hypothetical protein RHECNPAF_2530087 [Rhizobium etli CNPAF512]|nr:hypothetical protein RHECNPAF_2530087 [Rhizobium etli CNPAF512]